MIKIQTKKNRPTSSLAGSGGAVVVVVLENIFRGAGRLSKRFDFLGSSSCKLGAIKADRMHSTIVNLKKRKKLKIIT